MTEHVDMLREFTRAFDAYAAPYPQLPPAAVAKLRVDLIKEELGELRVALTLNDLIGVADALGDLLYVVHGAAIACGIDIDPVFAEIHRSNMTKLRKDGTVLYRHDGKVLKPDTYEPPNLARVLSEQVV